MSARSAPRTPRPMLVKDGVKRFDVADLQKMLPYVDQTTGLRNRIVERDPISGLGEMETTSMTLRHSRKNPEERDPITGKGNLGEEALGYLPRKSREREERDPITLNGNLGREYDPIYPDGRMKFKFPRDPQRDPVKGTGDFGPREWDPVWKYQGKVRASIPSETLAPTRSFRYEYKYMDEFLASKNQGNPITGVNVTSFNVTLGERKIVNRSQSSAGKKDLLTGLNCEDYDLNSEMKARPMKKNRSVHNILTGENCNDYVLSVEETRRENTQEQGKWKVADASNPILGQNCASYLYNFEKPNVTSKTYEYGNTITGENRTIYTLTPEEKKRPCRSYNGLDNTLQGAERATYDLNPNLKTRNQKKLGDNLNNPLTGENCVHYVLTKEDKKANENKKGNAVLKNVLTGENCDVYQLDREFRSEKKPSLSDASSTNFNRHVASYNIINGEQY